ncbi:MAG: polysaccharide lyase [Bacteroidales bacterium]|nr:polysaccharide lyase [Bacteroidales bacterium]
MKKAIFFLMIVAVMLQANAQRVELSARQPTDPTFTTSEAYRVINAALAGTGRNVMEIPDCQHLPEVFEHIRMVWDSILEEYVFEFLICVNDSIVDGDVQPDSWNVIYQQCNVRFTDRQRNEIKTDANSPRHLRGFSGDTVRYSWRFWLPPDFHQPTNAFTHIYQVKPVGGDDSQPIFALTVRQGGAIQIRYFNTSLEPIAPAIRPERLGSWIEVDHWMVVGVNGWSRMTITDVETGAVLHHHDQARLTLRPTNNFIRPKWGIYRSLQHVNQLRDERIRFSNFVIEFGTPDTTSTRTQEQHVFYNFMVIQSHENADIIVSGTPKFSGRHQVDLISLTGTVLSSSPYFLQRDIQQNIVICGQSHPPGLYLIRISTPISQEIHRIIIR